VLIDRNLRQAPRRTRLTSEHTNCDDATEQTNKQTNKHVRSQYLLAERGNNHDDQLLLWNLCLPRRRYTPTTVPVKSPRGVKFTQTPSTIIFAINLFHIASVLSCQAQVPLCRLPRNSSVRGSFGEVGVMELRLKGVSRVCHGRHRRRRNRGGNGGACPHNAETAGAKVSCNLQSLSADSSQWRTQNAPKILVIGPHWQSIHNSPRLPCWWEGFVGMEVSPSPHEPSPWLSSSDLELRPFWPRLALAMFISFRRHWTSWGSRHSGIWA